MTRHFGSPYRTPLLQSEIRLLSRVWEICYATSDHINSAGNKYTRTDRAYRVPSHWIREMLTRNHVRRGLTVAEKATVQGFIDHPAPAPTVATIDELARCFPPHEERYRPLFLAYCRHVQADAEANQLPDLDDIRSRITHYRSQPVTVPDLTRLTHHLTSI